MKNALTLCSIVIILYISLTKIMCMETQHSVYRPQPVALIYAPWREDYVNAQQKPKPFVNKSCTFCTIISNPDNKKNLVLYRGKHSLIMLASQPYIDNGIHFLIIPYEHKPQLSELSSDTYDEENMFTQKLCALFAPHANETYINSNQGVAAGASIPEHHHKHIMINYAPRYYNLVDAMRETKRSIDLQKLFHELQPQMNKLETVILPQHPISLPAHPDASTLLSSKRPPGLRSFSEGRLEGRRARSNNDHDCYHCSIMNGDIQENLIIHRGIYATIMLSHYPTYFGEIDIIPHEHIESLETMPTETYKEINQLSNAIYPILLKLVHAQDSNIGLISYGDNATHREHIQHNIIPRRDCWRKTPITRSNHINADVKRLYRKLLSEWHRAKL